jgi:hypothetical protein
MRLPVQERGWPPLQPARMRPAGMRLPLQDRARGGSAWSGEGPPPGQRPLVAPPGRPFRRRRA